MSAWGRAHRNVLPVLAIHYHIIQSVRKQNRYDGTGHEKKNAYRNSVLYAVVFQYVTLLTALFP